MKKGILAFVAAVLLALAVVTPAQAAVNGNSNLGGSVNDVEDYLLGEFDKVMTRDWFDDAHHNQYYEEARAALMDSRVNLNDTAKGEFEGVLKDIDAILDGCNSNPEAWSHYSEIAGIINKVSKNYKMTVKAYADNHYAEVMIDGGSSSGSKSSSSTSKPSVVASTASTVRQTGFDMGQTMAIVAGAAAVLAGAFFVARKNKLFA